MTADPHIQKILDAMNVLPYVHSSVAEHSPDAVRAVKSLASDLAVAKARATEAERVIVELRKHHDDLSAERGEAVARAAEAERRIVNLECELRRGGFVLGTSEAHAENERLIADLDAEREAHKQTREALRRIWMWPFDVNRTDREDVVAMQQTAGAALGEARDD